MINIIFIIMVYVLGIGLKWHIANLIAKTPNLSNTKVEALKNIAVRFQLPKIIKH